jgi:copper(I)-binding protein
MRNIQTRLVLQCAARNRGTALWHTAAMRSTRQWRQFIWRGTLLVLAASLAACGARSSGDQKGIEVRDAWIRNAAQGSDIAAGYLTIENLRLTPMRIVAVSSPIARHTMLHETTVESGVAKMRARNALQIEPGQSLSLRPGGLHLMLHGLTRALQDGEQIVLTLQLADGQMLNVPAIVRPLSAE